MTRGLALALALAACTASAPAPAPLAEDAAGATSTSKPTRESRDVTEWAHALAPRGAPARSAPSQALRWRSLEFAATRDAAAPADELRWSVRATNVGRRRATLDLDGCHPIHLQAYADASRGPPLWSERDHACEEGERLVFAPGASHTWVARIATREVLAGLPHQGTFEMVATLGPTDDRVELELGSVDLDGGLHELSFRTTTSLVEEREGPFKGMLNLGAEFEVRNDGPRAVTLKHNACPLELRAFRNAGRTGRPTWSTEDFGNHCIDIGLDPAKVEPGGTYKSEYFMQGVSLWELQQRKIPDARYYFTFVVRLDDVPLEVIGGEAVLVPSREPRPEG